MDIELRLEKPSDYAETENVVREAFWNVYAPGCCEHYLVHVIRESHNFVRGSISWRFRKIKSSAA